MINFLAKKIITQPPFSVTRELRIPQFMQKLLQQLDTKFHYRALALSDSFLADEWRVLQLYKLKKILTHAGKNVVFWKRIFKENGFDSKRLKDFDELKNLPVVSRAYLKSVPREDFMASNISKIRWVTASTSGSTSEPFSFFNDSRDIFRRRMNVFLELRHAGLSGAGRALVLGLGTLKGLRHYPLHVEPQEFESRERRVGRIYPLLNYHKPEILFSTPSYLRRFAHHCRTDGFNYIFKCIRFYGEAMELDERDELENFFGCGIYSTYGSHECSVIGIECVNRNMHTVPWLNYVEIVDDKGIRVPDGETGNIVVTFFENECMPFIRYKIGDRGQILKEKCVCGRNSLLLKFDGRVLGFLEFQDGSVYQVSHIANHLAEKFSDLIRRFQLEQPEPANIIFRYIPQKQNERILIESRLNNYFNSSIGDKVKIEYKAVDYIRPDTRGKTKVFIKNF